MSRMRAFLLLTVAIVLGAGAAHAVPVPGLFNTGVDDNGALLGAGVADAHYQLIVSADPNYPGPGAVVASPIATNYWLANSASSQWIAPAMAQGYPSGGTAHPGGLYTYRLSFDLTGFDLATVLVSWGCAMDNNGTIKLNGALLGGSVGGYNPLNTFSISSGFVAGLNHLDFQVTNFAAGGANPTGLRVQGLNGNGTMSTTPVPPSAAGAQALLLPCRPNPFNPRTTIRFDLPETGAVQLAVFDLAGRLVRELIDTRMVEGVHDADWEGRDAAGRKVASGSYVARLRFGGKVETVRMALVQ
jgi:hypothetical protein